MHIIFYLIFIVLKVLTLGTINIVGKIFCDIIRKG